MRRSALFVLLVSSLGFGASCWRGPTPSSTAPESDLDPLRGRPSCQVLPDPVTVGIEYEIRIEGLKREASFLLEVDEPAASHSFQLVSDMDGRAVAVLTATLPGPGSASVWLSQPRHRTRTTCAFEIIEPQCGDGLCADDEDCDSCAADCGACDPCGDGLCAADEDCDSCAADCGACDPCGDGVCAADEDCRSCAADCGACEPCGDGLCAADEDCDSCAADCGACALCGDQLCDGDETCSSCPADCGACSATPCSDLAATADVVLDVGDDFQAANDAHPSGTVFLIASGEHPGQRVNNPKSGTSWVGAPGAVLNGNGSPSDAFHGSATDVLLCNLEIRDYVDNGIYFTGGSGVIVDSISVYDTGSGSGESNGAARFDDVSGLTVVHSHFERVSSGVLPSNCTGPVVIEHNTGLNIGRNFVQLARVSGSGIRVRYNVMERDGTYLRAGNDDVEDWISVWSVSGLPEDYVQISFNRARGHGPSRSGSFIMLGDGGGSYQEAVGNIGVTCGQVGIGLSGGHYIEARENLMYSDQWFNSNIAFYSADYGTGGCGNHVLVNNSANWTNRDGRQNTFWTSGECTPLSTSGNRFPDPALTADIWDL